MVYLVNSHSNATRIGWHLWEKDLRCAPGLATFARSFRRRPRCRARGAPPSLPPRSAAPRTPATCLRWGGVFIHLYPCIPMYFIFTCIYLYIYIYICIYIYIDICIFIIIIHTYIYIYIYMYIFIDIYVYVYVYIYIHMYIYICIYINK